MMAMAASPFYTSMPQLQPIPTFFEILMSDRLNRSMSPAIRHIFSFFSQRFDDIPMGTSMTFFHAYFEEIETLLLGLLQYKSLLKHDALMAEKLYHLKRQTLVGEKVVALSSKQRGLTMLVEVFIPYLKRKLDLAYSSVSSLNHQSLHQQSRIWQLFLIWCFPIIQALYEGSALLSQLCYMVGGTRHFHPSQHSLRGYGLNQVYTRSPVPPQSPASNESRPASRSKYPWRWIATISAVAIYQGVSWWRRTGGSDHQPSIRDNNFIQRNTPPPPPPPLSQFIATDACPLPLDPTICPLCLNERIHAAASSSGCVFCYKCIMTYTEKNQKCPVTHLPCSPSQIIRIFDQ